MSRRTRGRECPAAEDYVEAMEQQLEDGKYHEDRAATYRRALTAFLGDRLAQQVLSPDAFPEFRRLVERAAGMGFDTFDGAELSRSILKEQIELHNVQLENLQLQRLLGDLRDCQKQIEQLQSKADVALEREQKRRLALTEKALSTGRHGVADAAEAKKFQEAADTLQADLKSIGYSDELTHPVLVDKHMSNCHLAAERQALVNSLARFEGLPPDVAQAKIRVAELEKQVALLEAQIHEQGKFLL